MAITLTQQQIEQQALYLTKTPTFRDVYLPYRREFDTSQYYPAVRETVIDFIYNFNLPTYPTATRDDATAVLDEFDYTYGQDFIYDTMDIYIREGMDPDKIVQDFFRSIADLHNYYDKLIKQLPALQNPFEVPEEFIGILGGTIGIDVAYGLPEEIKRFKVARAVPWYKVKGTHLSFEFLLRSLGFNARVVELWTDYDGTKYEENPDIYPILPDGSPNPAYNPNNTTDGLVKYKSSYFDLEATEASSNGLPLDIISTLLSGIEEVRPITRTLRRIYLTKNLEDVFPPVTDDDLIIQALAQFEDEAAWNEHLWPECLTYGCDGTGATYSGGYYYDKVIFFDDPSGTPTCSVYYDNALQPFYDGVAIADFSGLSSPGGQPFVYSGLYDITLTFVGCGEADLLDIIGTGYLEDFMFELSVELMYDNATEINFDSTTITYGGTPNIQDSLEINISGGIQLEDTVTIGDEIELEIDGPLEFEDDYSYRITYNGLYDFDNASTSYFDGVAIADYSGLVDGGGVPFNFSSTYDGTLFYVPDNVAFPDELVIIINPLNCLEWDNGVVWDDPMAFWDLCVP